MQMLDQDLCANSQLHHQHVKSHLTYWRLRNKHNPEPCGNPLNDDDSSPPTAEAEKKSDHPHLSQSEFFTNLPRMVLVHRGDCPVEYRDILGILFSNSVCVGFF